MQFLLEHRQDIRKMSILLRMLTTQPSPNVRLPSITHPRATTV